MNHGDCSDCKEIFERRRRARGLCKICFEPVCAQHRRIHIMSHAIRRSKQDGKNSLARD